MNIHSFLINFIKKYLFILKAAAEGWRVKYIGGNKFRFHTTHYLTYSHKNYPTSKEFVKRYFYE